MQCHSGSLAAPGLIPEICPDLSLTLLIISRPPTPAYILSVTRQPGLVGRPPPPLAWHLQPGSLGFQLQSSSVTLYATSFPPFHFPPPPISLIRDEDFTDFEAGLFFSPFLFFFLSYLSNTTLSAGIVFLSTSPALNTCKLHECVLSLLRGDGGGR